MDQVIEQDDKYTEFLGILQQSNKLSTNDLNKALRMQKSAQGETIPQLLIKLGLCSEKDIANSFYQSSQIKIVDVSAYPLESPFSDQISLRFLKHCHVIGL